MSVSHSLFRHVKPMCTQMSPPSFVVLYFLKLEWLQVYKCVVGLCIVGILGRIGPVLSLLVRRFTLDWVYRFQAQSSNWHRMLFSHCLIEFLLLFSL